MVENQWKSFEEARKFVRDLKLKNQNEWREYCRTKKRPDNIPTHPEIIYKDRGWVSWGDWFWNGNVRGKNFLSFKKVRKFVRKLKLLNINEYYRWFRFTDKSIGIPSNPTQIYKDQWKGWGDFLGTGRIAYQKREYLSFEEARKFVRKLKLKRQKEWRKYCMLSKKPCSIPHAVDKTYKNKGWVSWGDFLGMGDVREKDFLSFEEARKFVNKLKLKNRNEWREYCKSGKRPSNIPTHPEIIYKNKGWRGMKYWLGI